MKNEKIWLLFSIVLLFLAEENSAFVSTPSGLRQRRVPFQSQIKHSASSDDLNANLLSNLLPAPQERKEEGRGDEGGGGGGRRRQAVETTPPRRKTMTSRYASLGWVLAMVLLCLPPAQVAHAGFGPLGGATTSVTPGVSKINVEDLSEKKLRQLIGTSLDETRLSGIQAQFEALIDSITNGLNLSEDEEEESTTTTTTTSTTTTTTESSEETKKLKKMVDPQTLERLEKVRQLEKEIEARENMLDALEAQPKWFGYIAAFCGSVASTLVMHPVDTIKTRLQMQTSNSTTPISHHDDEGKQTTEVFSGLYEGLTGNLWKEGPPSALYLGVYETIKSALLHVRPETGSVLGIVLGSTAASGPSNVLLIYLMAGAAGELIGSTVRAPAEAVKSLVQSKAAASATEAVQRVLGTLDGRENVVRAWSASILRDVPFGAIQLALFELIKVSILNNPDIDFDSGTLQAEAIIGAFAGACGAFLTTPADVITTRIITQSESGDNSGGEGGGDEPLNALSMGRLIYEEGGIMAFFAGWKARVLYWAPAISIFLTCYCSVRQLGVRYDLFGG